MARPFILPTVTTRRIKGVSLDDLAKRVTGGPKYVRVGLPDRVRSEDDGRQDRTPQPREAKE
jgi:hypothetical protein